MAELDTCKFLLDKSGRRWVNEEQIANAGYRDFQEIDLIKVGEEEYYDVIGYSEKRRAFWLEPVVINTDNLEEVVAEYVESLRDDSVGS